MSDTKRSGGVSGPHKGERSVAQPKNTRNNHAERGVDYAPKGEKARINANIAAIELAKRLIESGATATPQEMAVLRKYSGWGGLGSAFKEGLAYAPNPINVKLREVLTPEEYDTAVMSVNSAYYTPATYIDAMWDIARALGFKGGNVLEGSAGIGNIIGLMPIDLSEQSNIHAVEIDRLTGSILSLLYPDAKVDIKGFEQTKIQNGTVDLSITNVPFVTDLSVTDETGDKDLSKKFRDIHDFCIAKNVRKLREGGIGIFITSSGTLDRSQKLRNWLVGDKEGASDVVGAFRLNNQTFGGTGATSDIIVVRKRVNGRRSENAIDVSTVSPVRTIPITVEGKTRDHALLYNRYFIEHPENMGGEMFFGVEQGDKTYRPASIGLYPTRTADQDGRVAQWVQSLVEKDWSKEQGTRAAATQEANVNEALGEGVKEGSMVKDSEGNLCVARMGRAVPLTLNNNKIKGRTKEQCFADYTEIKDALAEVLKYQTEHDDDAGLQPLLDRLNKAYDTFVDRYGHLNKNNNLAWLKNDVDFSSIVALETYSEKGSKDGSKVKSYGKTDIFSRRVVDKEVEPAPKNVKDGIIASIYKYGFIDPVYIAEHLGKSKGTVINEIVESGLGFLDPLTGQVEVAYEYLSGNVREKLREAREANEDTDGTYAANIKALEAVIPMNIPGHLIEFTLGSSWIEPQVYERYIKERTDLDVKLRNIGGTWNMKPPYYTSTEKNKEMGVRSEVLNVLYPGHEIIEAAITNKTITVSRTIKDRRTGESETITDPAATQAIASKVDEIRQDFKDWARELMQRDPELSMRMEEVYNEKFNNSVPKSIPDEFVPEHFGGAATMVGGKPFKLRPHQAKAVIRATTQPVLLAHEVGTGKTYTLITTAMEMRRLGTARKPMIVVQNATVGQFVASAKALYPNAKVLTLEDADRNAEGRKAFYAKIKFNDWDMIVVPQSVFERIPDSMERQMQFIKDKVEEKLLVLEQMKEDDPDGKSMIVRQAKREIEDLELQMAQLAAGETPTTTKKGSKKKEKDAKKAAVTRQNAEVKAKEMLDRETDDVEDFDSMGIDAILVDEAHEYKHLGFATAMQRGVKGVDPSYSKKSQGVYLKAQAVLEKTGGKNVVFATGTPISNTAAEIWTFMRYLMPADTMKEYGIYYFDDFVRNFGNLQQMLEFTTSGKYKENNRFAGYVNLPELVRIWSGVADTVLTREAGGVSDKIPEMEGGKAQDIFLPQTRALRSVMKSVKSKLDRYDKMSGKEKKENSHIPLTMYGIAKAAAVDARLVQGDAEDDPNSKTNEAVRQTLRTLEETKDYNGTIAIFADNYQNKKSGFNLYDDIQSKLIANGVPAEQIVIMRSGMTVKKKLEIFDKVNAGEIRVIMGSTFTLGTGVNIQERLHTLIHLDAPNRPMDYTQRNGRLLRQGNLHKEWGLPVRVLRFGVEDSLDVTAYQRLKTKGAIADSIMNGKTLMDNSMENRALEEDQDLFGDITAQLSGSEYAMLKNQVEKEVRKLSAKKKQWEADQTYIHNRKRQIVGQNKDAEQRVADNKASLEKIEAAEIGTITVGKHSFPDVTAMEEFFKEQNKKKAEMQEQVRKGGYNAKAQSDLTISIGGFNFNIHTEIIRETKSGQTGDLFYSAPAKMTYSCKELGIENSPVTGNVVKNAVNEIMDNVLSGEDFRGRIEAAERLITRNNAEMEAISARDGVPFQFSEELAKAEEKLAEYEELMKKEMEEKEAKYAEMDKDVTAATDIEAAEEDSEDEASEPIAEYGKTRNFASRYNTNDGKQINYTSENPEAYGVSDTPGGRDNSVDSGRGDVQRQENPLLTRRDSGLDEAAGEFSLVERVFTETGTFKFTSGEKIESADDVAFIFSALEDAAKEHSFAVFVKDGKPTVVELGMGTFNATMVDIPTAALAYERIQPDEVYFVHNHPSGNLICSLQDREMLRKFESMSDVPVHGIIINLKTGKYGRFDGTLDNLAPGTKRIPETEQPMTVHSLDKQIFAPNYNPANQPQVRGADDVAAFLNSQRMGDRPKVSFLVLSQDNRIVGNIHTPFTEVESDVNEKARYISERVIQFGGTSAILYGDFDITSNNGGTFRAMQQRIKEVGGVNLLDVVNVEGNFTRSAQIEGMLREPGTEYGTTPDTDLRFREVEDEAVLQEFAEGKPRYTPKKRQKFANRIRKHMADRVADLCKILHLDNVDVITDTTGLDEKHAQAKGWYSRKTGRITIVLSNHASIFDVEKTLLHEAVAHYGLRKLFGKHFSTFLDNVYDAADPDIRRKIADLAAKKGWDFHTATEEYLASLAEDTEFDAQIQGGFWAKVKRLFFDMLEAMGFKDFAKRDVTLSDNELRYLLWASYRNLQGDLRNPFAVAEDVAMQDNLKVGNYADNEVGPGEVAEEGNDLMRDDDFSPRGIKAARAQYNDIVSSGRYQFREAVQDSMRGLYVLYESILGKDMNIEDVKGFENAYLFENRMSSMNAGEQHEYFTQYMRPIIEEIYELCGDSTTARKNLQRYMMAKHGIERNMKLAERDALEMSASGKISYIDALAKCVSRDYSGLTALTGEQDVAMAEMEAQKIVADYEGANETKYLWAAVKDATSATLAKIYHSGLLSKERYEKIRDMFDNYIPLQGWDETTSDEVYGYLTSNDGPLGGSPLKRANGRTSLADDPIATIGMMADAAIRQGNRNLMKQRLLNFVLNNPSDIVSVQDLWLQHNDVNGEWEPIFSDIDPTDSPDDVARKVEAFEARMTALAQSDPDHYKRGRDAINIPYKVVKGNLKEHQILVKRNGRTYVLTINGNPRAAQAVNGLTNPDVENTGVIGNMLKLGEYVNRQLSAFYTTRNPDFVVSNFFRDMLYSNCMAWVKESPRYAIRFHKNFGKVNPLRLRKLIGYWERGELDRNNYLENMFYLFMMNGGETGYTSVKDIEGHKRTIANELKKEGSVGRRVWNALGMQLDMLNRSVENCARFAAFITSREMGRNLDRAIYDAKEVSVNFNKKGSGGKLVNATGQTRLGKIGSYLGGGGRIAYVFWNAGIQGMTNFGRNAKRNPKKATAGAVALFALGLTIPLLAQLMGGGDGDDDDKNAYYNLPEYVRRSNICFKAGEQWITIPLPIEYRALYGLGELCTGVVSGNERYGNWELTRQLLGQVSQTMPLDVLEGGGGVSPFIPSAAKPFTEAYIMNKGWTGLPIYKDNAWNKNDPEWTKAYANADTHLVNFAKWINETTGGDDYTKGAIDINPAKIEYLLSGTFGGLFTTWSKAKKMGETAFGDREFDWRNMIIANRLVKTGDERTANRKLQNEYFKYKQEYEQTGKRLRNYENAAEEGVLGYAEKVDFLYNSPEYARWEIFEDFETDLESYRAEIKEETDPEIKKQLQEEMYATMRELVNALHDPDEYLKDATSQR